MMATATVYGDPMSRPTRAVVLMLKLNNIDYDFKYWSVLKRTDTLWSDEYIKINPFKKVPVLQIDGLTITESYAALQYLGDREGVADHWYPKDPKQRMQVNSYLAWQGQSLRPASGQVMGTHFIGPAFWNQTKSEEDISKAREQIKGQLNMLNNIWLKDNTFLTGDDITLADIVAMTEMSYLEVLCSDLVEELSNIQRWIKVVKERLQPQYNAVSSEIVAAVTKAFQQHRAGQEVVLHTNIKI